MEKIKVYGKSGGSLGVLAPDSVRGGEAVFNAGRDLLVKSGGVLYFRLSVSILDIQGYWIPENIRPKMKLDWRIGFLCGANKNFPYIAFFSSRHENRVSVYSTNQMDDSSVSAKMNQETGNYDVEFAVSVSSETEEFQIAIDVSDTCWPEILKSFRERVLKGESLSFPKSAWEPVYCTWYAAHASFDTAWLDRQAEAAAEAGFGTFIVDDGWCFDESRRVSPETIGSWYEKIGDWEASGKKLPGFREHISRAKGMGLNYMLWVSPFMVGVNSRFAESGGRKYLTEEHEGYRIFDPADKSSSEEILGKLSGLVKEYGLDGLKVDFVDSVPRSLTAPRGRAVYEFIDALVSRVKKDMSEALFEFRQKYATPVMLRQATQFRAGDVPYDFIDNFLRIAHLRLCLGDGVPAHADPAYWHPEETDSNVSRHMIASLAGVPMLSMALDELSESHRLIIRGWLDFYMENIEIFRKGRWDIGYEFDYVSFVSAALDGEKIVVLNSPAALPGIIECAEGILHVLNLCAEPLRLPSAVAYNCFNAEDGREEILPGGRGKLTLNAVGRN